MLAKIFFYRNCRPVPGALWKPFLAQSSSVFQFDTSKNSLQKRLFFTRPSLDQQLKQESNSKLAQQQKVRLDPKSQQVDLVQILRQRRRRPKLRESTIFQESDGLKASEWTLIYHNSGTLWLFTMFLVYSAVSLVVMAVGVEEMAERRKQLRTRNEPETIKKIVNRKAFSSLVLGLAIFSTMMRFRRCWVVRIYEKNLQNQGKPPAPVVVETGAPAPKTMPPVRHYCIVWTNMILRRRLYFYSSDQTDRVKEAPPLITNILGNYRARNRSWAVFAHYFEDPLDYYRVRGKKVAGSDFVA